MYSVESLTIKYFQLKIIEKKMNALTEEIRTRICSREPSYFFYQFDLINDIASHASLASWHP